jgi:hypothetical protein
VANLLPMVDRRLVAVRAILHFLPALARKARVVMFPMARRVAQPVKTWVPSLRIGSGPSSTSAWT